MHALYVADTLTLYRELELSAEVPLTKTGIAWPTDLKSKFKNPDDFADKGCNSEGKYTYIAVFILIASCRVIAPQYE